MRKSFTSLAALIFVLTLSAVINAQTRRHPDDKLHDDLVIIKGRVTFTDFIDFDKNNDLMNPVGIFFQRVGCKRCVFSTLFDNRGYIR